MRRKGSRNRGARKTNRRFARERSHAVHGASLFDTVESPLAYVENWKRRQKLQLKKVITGEGCRLPSRQIRLGEDAAVKREWLDSNVNIEIRSKEGTTILQAPEPKKEYFMVNPQARGLLKFAVLTNLSMVASDEAKEASNNVETQLRVKMAKRKNIPNTNYQSLCSTGGDEMSLVLDLGANTLGVVTKTNINAMVTHSSGGSAPIPPEYGGGDFLTVATLTSTYDIEVDAPQSVATVTPSIQISPELPKVDGKAGKAPALVERVIFNGLLDTAAETLSSSAQSSKHVETVGPGALAAPSPL